ncbi:hypothetical protein GW17_00028629, partial [Ensete ventricosum]
GTGRSDGIDPSCFFLFFLSAARFPTRLRFPLKKTSSDLPRHSYDPKAPGTLRVSMAMRTLGNFGVQAACWSYIFIHYALLVAYVARSSEILTNTFNIPLYEDSI